MKYKERYKDCSEKIMTSGLAILNPKLKITSLEGYYKEIAGSFICSNVGLLTLKGCPIKIKQHFDCSKNNISSLEYCPKEITGSFNCQNNPELKNVKEQIIKNQIKAYYYKTDEENFSFEDIKEEFEKYRENIKKEQNRLKKKQDRLKLTSETKKNLKEDYGLSL